jgi:hypothetical protein
MANTMMWEMAVMAKNDDWDCDAVKRIIRVDAANAAKEYNHARITSALLLELDARALCYLNFENHQRMF